MVAAFVQVVITLSSKLSTETVDMIACDQLLILQQSILYPIDQSPALT